MLVALESRLAVPALVLTGSPHAGPAKLRGNLALVAFSPNDTAATSFMHGFVASVACPEDPTWKAEASPFFPAFFRWAVRGRMERARARELTRVRARERERERKRERERERERDSAHARAQPRAVLKACSSTASQQPSRVPAYSSAAAVSQAEMQLLTHA